MIICPDCKETNVRKNGIIEREIMKKSGRYLQKVPSFQGGIYFLRENITTIPSRTNKMKQK